MYKGTKAKIFIVIAAMVLTVGASYALVNVGSDESDRAAEEVGPVTDTVEILDTVMPCKDVVVAETTEALNGTFGTIGLAEIPSIGASQAELIAVYCNADLLAEQVEMVFVPYSLDIGATELTPDFVALSFNSDLVTRAEAIEHVESWAVGSGAVESAPMVHTVAGTTTALVISLSDEGNNTVTTLAGIEQ